MERINSIRNQTNASSVTDVIKSAVLTYEALVEFMADGNSSTSEKRETTGSFL